MSQYLLQFFKGLLQNFAVPQYRNTYLQMSDNLVICFVFHILYCTLLYCIEIICFTSSLFFQSGMVWQSQNCFAGIVWQSLNCMVALSGRVIVWCHCMVVALSELYGWYCMVESELHCQQSQLATGLALYCCLASDNYQSSTRFPSMYCNVYCTVFYVLYCILYCILNCIVYA